MLRTTNSRRAREKDLAAISS